MRVEIVVCGTFQEWIHFLRWKNRMESYGVKYLPLINNEHRKLMGLKKSNTSVVKIGTWYETITEDTEKFLMLFGVN
jgi:hypothetical protein